MARTRILSLRSRTLMLLAVLASIAGVLLWGTWQEVRSGGREIERMMTEHAISVIDLIAESGSHGLEAYRRWEEEVVQRLMDDALWVARFDSISTLDSRQLQQLAATHDLHRINLFDAQGNREVSSWSGPYPRPDPRHNPKELLAPILEGRAQSIKIGIKTARFEEGTRLAVAVARPRGGAIVVNVSADSLRATLDRVGPGHLFRTLGETPGVRYIAIQNDEGILAASADLTALPALRDDPELASLDPTHSLVTREIDSPMGPVFEVARRMRFPEGEPVVLRIGLASTALDQARSALHQRTFMRTGILAVIVGLAAALLLAWQRHGILDREVARVRAELRAREQEALQAQKLVAMGELASGVAHEIRNPLNAIHMIAQQLERESGLDTELKTQVGHMTAESRRIEGIVQQFLTFARPRQPQFERFDLAEVTSTASKTAAAAFEAAGIRLNVKTEPVMAELDRGFVTEIVENLLRNAREASPAGGEVNLTVQRDGAEVILAVEDDGPGVPTETRERIFNLYFTTKPEGTGLGLALVTQMAAAMRGGIRLDEMYQRGARFVVHFPVRKDSK